MLERLPISLFNTKESDLKRRNLKTQDSNFQGAGGGVLKACGSHSKPRLNTSHKATPAITHTGPYRGPQPGLPNSPGDAHRNPRRPASWGRAKGSGVFQMGTPRQRCYLPPPRLNTQGETLTWEARFSNSKLIPCTPIQNLSSLGAPGWHSG